MLDNKYEIQTTRKMIANCLIKSSKVVKVYDMIIVINIMCALNQH